MDNLLISDRMIRLNRIKYRSSTDSAPVGCNMKMSIAL